MLILGLGDRSSEARPETNLPEIYEQKTHPYRLLGPNQNPTIHLALPSKYHNAFLREKRKHRVRIPLPLCTRS